MKTKLIICILIIISNLSCSSNKLDGLFEFKLGMSEEEMRELVDAKLLKKKESSWGDNNTTYYDLERYTSKDGYLAEKIMLYFAYNKLYYIVIQKYNSKLEDLLTLKYGEPNVETKENLTKMTKTWNTSSKSFNCSSILERYAHSESYELRLSTHIVESLTLKQFIAHFLPAILYSLWIFYLIIAIPLVIIYLIWIKKM